MLATWLLMGRVIRETDFLCVLCAFAGSVLVFACVDYALSTFSRKVQSRSNPCHLRISVGLVLNALTSRAEVDDAIALFLAGVVSCLSQLSD